jgi:hypothetical protein
MAQVKRGRASMFRGKEDGVRVQGLITKTGGAKFELARRALGDLYSEVYGVRPTTVSDADVIEYMARGKDGTRAYLEAERTRARR